MGKTVLVVSAHTDDEVLGVGGTIARHTASGDEVYVCSLADRATKHQYDQKVIADLREMALKAAETLGVKETYFCGLLDERLELLGAIDHIEKYISELKPDIVYTHHRGDTNQDHKVAFRATLIATRCTIKHTVKRLLCYEVPSSTDQGSPFVDDAFLPNVFVNISQTLEIKLKAMQAYAIEVREYPHPRSLDALKALAQYHGVKVGLKAAEAFMLVREVIQ